MGLTPMQDQPQHFPGSRKWQASHAFFQKVFMVIALTLFSLVSTTVFATGTSSGYIIYIDAGSSGTRLHLYRYESTGTQTPQIEEIPVDSNESSTTLASFYKHPLEAGNQLIKPLLDHAKAKLDELNKADPKHPISNVPVYLLGTAGMRLMQDRNAANVIYAVAKQYVLDNYKGTFFAVATVPNTHDNNFDDLNGDKEALFGWLEVNYLLGNFAGDTQTAAVRKSTVGSIDFGGASLEIAFEVPNLNTVASEALKIGGQQYYVYVQSFSDLGQSKTREEIKNIANAETCFPQGYTTKNEDKTKTIKGNFSSFANANSFDACQSVCNSLLGKKEHDEELKQIPSGLKGAMTFYGHSGINKTYNFFQVTSDPGIDGTAANQYHGTKESMKSRVEGICSKDMSKADAGEIDDAGYFCPLGVFIHYFIYEKLSLNSSQLIVTNLINGKKIGWTLGAVLNGLIFHNNPP